MDFRNILQSLNTISEGDVSHKAGPGGYGNRHGSETQTDQYGKPIGKVSLASLAPKDDKPKKRGPPVKADKPLTGKDDPKNKKVRDIFGRTTGDVPTGIKGTKHGLSANEKLKKKSLKEFIDVVEENKQLDESESAMDDNAIWSRYGQYTVQDLMQEFPQITPKDAQTIVNYSRYAWDFVKSGATKQPEFINAKNQVIQRVQQAMSGQQGVVEAKPGYPASRNALDLQPFDGSGPGAGFGGRSNVLPIIPNNMPGGRNMPAGAGGPKWVPTKIPGVKVHVGPPPTSTPAGSTPKLPANYEQPAIFRKQNIEIEFSNFLKGQGPQTLGTPSVGSGRGAQSAPTAAELKPAAKPMIVPPELISPNYKGTAIKAGPNSKFGTATKAGPNSNNLGSLGAERPGLSRIAPELDQPRPPGSGLDEADEISMINPGKLSNQEFKDYLNQRHGQPDKNTSWMNKQHQDFYDKNPSFKQAGKFVGTVGDSGRFASTVLPSVTDTKVERIPMNTFGAKQGSNIPKSIQKGGGGRAGGAAGLGGMKPGQSPSLDNPLMHEEAKDLPGNRDKLDVAPPKGKLTSADFKALSKKKKVKESNIMSIVESINFKELMANADADVQEMLMELQNDVEMFKETGHSSELLDSFLKVHLHKKNRITDESIFDEEVGAGRGVVNPPVVNPNAAVPPARTASPGWGKDDYEPLIPSKPTDSAMGVIKGGTWQSDPKGTVKAPSGDPEGVREAGSFIRGLAASRKTFEGKTMKDVQLESWEKELNNLLNEGITVSTSTGQQGAPDSVSINATDSDANELLNILRQSGMGVFGGNDKPTMTPYGVVSQGEEEPTGTGTEPEMSPEVVGDGDDMLSLIKKMSGLSAGPVGQDPEGTASSDYEDENSEEVDEQYLSEPIVPKPNPDNTQPPSTPAPPPATPGSEATNEEEMEEGNKFTGNLAKARAAGKKEADLDGDGDMEKVKEGHDHEECNECGYAMESCECEEKVEEGFSNDAGGDAMADTELAKLKALLTMGGDLHKMKRSQSVGNPTQVSMAESLAQWKRLSGIK